MRTIATYQVTVDKRTPDEPMGRFGGGFNWAIGLRAGGRTLVINLLVFSIIITRKEVS